MYVRMYLCLYVFMYMHVRTYVCMQVANVYTVSEEDMMHYHDVFSDSGNTQAQVWFD